MSGVLVDLAHDVLHVSEGQVVQVLAQEGYQVEAESVEEHMRLQVTSFIRLQLLLLLRRLLGDVVVSLIEDAKGSLQDDHHLLVQSQIHRQDAVLDLLLLLLRRLLKMGILATSSRMVLADEGLGCAPLDVILESRDKPPDLDEHVLDLLLGGKVGDFEAEHLVLLGENCPRLHYLPLILA